jgi:glutaredoxin
LSLPRVTLYGRKRCHLCEVAKAALLRVHARSPFELHEVDVDSDPDLAADYGALVPVVELAGRRVAAYHVDEALLEQQLRESRA